jgi:Cdc6-like AAA superfamily ATPase
MSIALRDLLEDRIPDRMPHRNAEIHELSNALGPIEYGGPPDNARIVGPSGSGKTTLAQFTLRRYEQDGDGELNWRHIDCIQHSTPAAILHQCVQALSGVSPSDYTLGAEPKSLYVEELEISETPFVAVLDEASDVDDTKVFAMLHNIDGVGVWAVAHSDEAIMSRVSQTVGSRLRSGPIIQLDTYTVNQLVDIMEARVSGAVREGLVTDDALEGIADRAAGNAREALWILRYAIQQAQSGEQTSVDRSTVLAVTDEAQRQLRDHNLNDRLDTEHQVIHAILEKNGELSGPEIHERLEERMDQTYTGHARRAFLAKLREYDAVEKHGNTRNTTYTALPLE